MKCSLTSQMLNKGTWHLVHCLPDGIVLNIVAHLIKAFRPPSTNALS